MAFLLILFVIALLLGAAYLAYRQHRNWPENRATIQDTFLMDTGQDEGPRVACALRSHMRFLRRISPKVESIYVWVETRNGLAELILDEIKAHLKDKDDHLRFSSEGFQQPVRPKQSSPLELDTPESRLGGSGQPGEVLPIDPRKGPRFFVKTPGVRQIKASHGYLRIRNHSQIPTDLAFHVPRVLSRFRTPMRVRVQVSF